MVPMARMETGTPPASQAGRRRFESGRPLLTDQRLTAPSEPFASTALSLVPTSGAHKRAAEVRENLCTKFFRKQRQHRLGGYRQAGGNRLLPDAPRLTGHGRLREEDAVITILIGVFARRAARDPTPELVQHATIGRIAGGQIGRDASQAVPPTAQLRLNAGGDFQLVEELECGRTGHMHRARTRRRCATAGPPHRWRPPLQRPRPVAGHPRNADQGYRRRPARRAVELATSAIRCFSRL